MDSSKASLLFFCEPSFGTSSRCHGVHSNYAPRRRQELLSFGVVSIRQILPPVCYSRNIWKSYIAPEAWEISGGSRISSLGQLFVAPDYGQWPLISHN